MFTIIEKLNRIEHAIQNPPQKYRGINSSFEPLIFEQSDLDYLYLYIPSSNKFTVRGRDYVNEDWDYGTASIDTKGFLNITYKSGEKEKYQTTPLKFHRSLIEIDRYSFIRCLGLYQDPGSDGDYSFLGADEKYRTLINYVVFLPIFAQNFPKEQLISEFQLASSGLISSDSL